VKERPDRRDGRDRAAGYRDCGPARDNRPRILGIRGPLLVVTRIKLVFHSGFPSRVMCIIRMHGADWRAVLIFQPQTATRSPIAGRLIKQLRAVQGNRFASTANIFGAGHIHERTAKNHPRNIQRCQG
jgi:hypothetical protein